MSDTEYEDLHPLEAVAEILDLPADWLVELAKAHRIPALRVGEKFYATSAAVALRLGRMQWENVKP